MTQRVGRAAREASTPGAVNGPQLVTETKFMQQYRVAAAAHGGGDIAAVRNGSGQVEIFTVGTNGAVWNFYPDPTSDTGYSSIQTGLSAKAVAAGVDDSGRIIVFAANNVVLNYVRETGQTGAARWGSVQQATVPMPVSPIAIAKIYAQEIGGSLYVGVLTQFKSISPGNTYAFSYTIWDQAPGTFTATTMTLSTLNCVWSGSAAATAEFTCLDQTYLGYEIASRSITRYSVAAIFNSLSVDAALDSASNNQYFAILSDGNLYHLVGGGQRPFSWAQVTQQMSLRRIEVDRDTTGALHLFALGTDARVYHLAPEASGGWSSPAPIQTGIGLMAIGANDAGDIELFLVGTAQGAMTHMIRDLQTSDWEVSAIEVPTSGQVEEFISYSTDVTVYDAAGAPLPNTAIQVWASAQTELSVNGATYVVDPRTPANLVANGAGMLSITQQTNSLGAATLEFNVAALMPVGQSLAVRQFAGVQDRLATVNSGDLMQAKDAEGGFLLSDKYRTCDTTKALATAFNQCMKLADSTQVSLDASRLSQRARKLGVGACRAGGTEELNRIRAPADPAHWQLDFSGGKVVYRELTAEAAHLLVLEKEARHPNVEGFFDFFEDIGDFIVGIGQGIVDVIDTVITTVGNAIKAVITFIIDGVTYIFNTVVNFIEQAFDLVEAFFAKVKVFFEKMFEWLGFLFAWNDILRTHAVLAYTVEQFLLFLEGAAGGIQTIIDNGIATAGNQIDALFDQLVATVGAGSSMGGYIKKEEPNEPRFSSAVANNPVLAGTVDNAGSASSALSSAALAKAAGDSSPFDIIITNLKNLAQTVENLPEFNQALDYMKNLGGSPDQIFQQLLSALLRIMQGIIKAILAGVQAVMDSLLQIVGSIVAGVRELLTAEWNIPFVSSFYTWLTDSKLTLLDLFALLIAIPSTVLYKVVKGAAPFPDQASVDAFEASFSAQTMLARSGLGPKTAAPLAGAEVVSGAQVSAPVVLLGIAGIISTWVYGILTAIMDVKPMTGAGIVDPAVKTLAKFALGAEILGQAFATPWISSSEAPNCDTKDGAGQIAWIYECFGVVLDAGFTWYDEAFPENNDTIWGLAVATVYGIGHAITVGIVGKHLSGWGLAAKISILIPELTKWLRLPVIEGWTGGWSLIGIATIDGLGILVSAILAFVDTLSSAESEEAMAIVYVPGSVRPAT